MLVLNKNVWPLCNHAYMNVFQSTHVVCNDPEKADISYKCQMAAKFGLPVVSIQWINQCVEKGTLLDTDDFLVVGKSRSERLKEGKISGK